MQPIDIPQRKNPVTSTSYWVLLTLKRVVDLKTVVYTKNTKKPENPSPKILFYKNKTLFLAILFLTKNIKIA